MIQIIKMDKVAVVLIHWIFSKEWLNWTNRKIQLKNIFFITSYHHRLSSWWLEVVVWSKWNILKERKIETSGRCICVFCCWLSSFSSYWFVAVALQPFANQKQKQNKIHPVVNRNCEIVEIVSRFVVIFWLIISLILSCHHHWPINSICYFNWIQCSFKTNLSTLKKHWIESLTEFAISSIIIQCRNLLFYSNHFGHELEAKWEKKRFFIFWFNRHSCVFNCCQERHPVITIIINSVWWKGNGHLFSFS